MGVNKMSLAPGLRGEERLGMIRMHRLAMFQLAFEKYLDGECSSEYLEERVRKCLEVGFVKHL